MLLTRTVRWGRFLTWGAVLAACVAAVVLCITFLPDWDAVRGNGGTEKKQPAEASERVCRTGKDTLRVPAEVLRSIGLQTAETTMATHARSLAPLTGVLAINSNRLVRVHTRFAGEVVALGRR